jgi:uncharacterized protein YcfJ
VKFKQRFVSSVVTFCLAVTSVGCVTTGSSGGPNSALSGGSGAVPVKVVLTPAELRLREEKKRFDSTMIGGVLQGAMVGAAVGALATLFAGGNSKDAVKGAAIGAVAGGAIGGVDGYHKAKLQQAKMDEVAAIQSATADVHADSAKLQALLDTSTAVVNEGTQRLAVLSADVSAKQKSVAEADAARKREAENLALMRDALTNAQKTRDTYAKASDSFRANQPDRSRELDSEIAKMTQNVAVLERNVNDYGKALVASRA